VTPSACAARVKLRKSVTAMNVRSRSIGTLIIVPTGAARHCYTTFICYFKNKQPKFNDLDVLNRRTGTRLDSHGQ
jgi:hypothetical protein